MGRIPASTGVRYSARFVAPILNAAGFVPVMIGVMVVLSFVEYRFGFDSLTTLRYNGVVVAAAVLTLGGFVFGLLDQALVRLEGLRAPTVHDHLCHCAALFVFVGVLAILLVASYGHLAAHGVSLGYGLPVVGFLSALYAVSIDALLLRIMRRRLDRVNLEGGA